MTNLFTRTFRISDRLALTVTVPHPRGRRDIHANAFWTPSNPGDSLTPEERAAVSRAEQEIGQEAARVLCRPSWRVAVGPVPLSKPAEQQANSRSIS